MTTQNPNHVADVLDRVFANKIKQQVDDHKDCDDNYKSIDDIFDMKGIANDLFIATSIIAILGIAIGLLYIWFN